MNCEPNSWLVPLPPLKLTFFPSYVIRVVFPPSWWAQPWLAVGPCWSWLPLALLDLGKLQHLPTEASPVALPATQTLSCKPNKNMAWGTECWSFWPENYCDDFGAFFTIANHTFVSFSKEYHNSWEQYGFSFGGRLAILASVKFNMSAITPTP